MKIKLLEVVLEAILKSRTAASTYSLQGTRYLNDKKKIKQNKNKIKPKEQK